MAMSQGATSGGRAAAEEEVMPNASDRIGSRKIFSRGQTAVRRWKIDWTNEVEWFGDEGCRWTQW